MSSFCADILAPKNFKPKTQLCNFWRQNSSEKSARKMLMKLTPVYQKSTVNLRAQNANEIDFKSRIVIHIFLLWFCSKSVQLKST